jgi:hypothetical protein
MHANGRLSQLRLDAFAIEYDAGSGAIATSTDDLYCDHAWVNASKPQAR